MNKLIKWSKQLFNSILFGECCWVRLANTQLEWDGEAREMCSSGWNNEVTPCRQSRFVFGNGKKKRANEWAFARQFSLTRIEGDQCRKRENAPCHHISCKRFAQQTQPNQSVTQLSQLACYFSRHQHTGYNSTFINSISPFCVSVRVSVTCLWKMCRCYIKTDKFSQSHQWTIIVWHNNFAQINVISRPGDCPDSPNILFKCHWSKKGIPLRHNLLSPPNANQRCQHITSGRMNDISQNALSVKRNSRCNKKTHSYTHRKWVQMVCAVKRSSKVLANGDK